MIIMSLGIENIANDISLGIENIAITYRIYFKAMNIVSPNALISATKGLTTLLC